VPARTLQELARVAAAAEVDEIRVAARENQVVFGVGATVLSSRLVEGRFPNYQQLLPESYEHELRIERAEILEVVAGPAKFHLRTLPPEDFPKLPEAPAEGSMTVPAGAFVDTIARVARAASRDETRPHLTGVLVTASGRELRMVATDSYRLSVKETQLDEPLEGSLEANVPARTLQELGRIAGAGSSETIGVAALENQVVFTVDDVVLSSRLVEGRFPNYQQLLPESYEHELRVSRDELVEVVRRVGLLAQKNAPLRLRFEEGTLAVSAQTPDVGEASESLPIPFAGEPLEIGFNPEFFRDGLESAESEELILKLISPLRPGLIQSGQEGSDFLYLVMPIRLNV